MKPTGGDVAAFLAKVTPVARRRDADTIAALLTEVTGEQPELWGTIVGFGSCHYSYPTGTEGDSPVLGFAPRRKATTIYLLDGIDAHRDDLDRLGPHSTGVGCLYLPDVEAIDLDVLRRILSDSRDYVHSGGGEYATLTLNDA